MIKGLGVYLLVFLDFYVCSVFGFDVGGGFFRCCFRVDFFALEMVG